MKYYGPADGVFEGGGVKGIALVGALKVASEYVTEWKSLAGTSGGAIVAALLAAGYSADNILGFLLGQGIPGVIDSFKIREIPRRRSLARIPYVSELVNLIAFQGCYSGDYFEELLAKVLEKGPTPITTFESLKAPEEDVAKGHPPYRLQFIATDLTHKQALILPQDLKDPDQLSVAKAVRMSMSIPMFFEPVTLDTDPLTVIVDGGVVSNYPIWLFDSTGSVDWPTFGFLLDEKEENGRTITGIGPVARYLVDTAMGGLNNLLIKKVGESRTIAIDVKGFRTTEFDISEPRRNQLLESGRVAATTFFEKFDPSQYKNSLGSALTGDAMRQYAR